MTRTPRRTSIAAVLTVLAMSLTACGGGDEDKASKSISDGIMKAQKSGGASEVVTVKRKDADCIGDGLVDKLGVDKLKKYKVLDKDLKAENDITRTKMSSGDAKKATDVFFGCTDMKALVKKAINSTGKLSPTIQSCIDKSLTDSNLRAFLTATLEGKGDDATKALTTPLQKCATA